VTGTDTVERAAATAGLPQPFAELGLTQAEYEKIVGTLGRRPTSAELALYSVMWSEHCSYKSSKVHLRQFAAKAPPTPSGPVVDPNRITLLPAPLAAATCRSPCRITPTQSALTNGFPA